MINCIYFVLVVDIWCNGRFPYSNFCHISIGIVRVWFHTICYTELVLHSCIISWNNCCRLCSNHRNVYVHLPTHRLSGYFQKKFFFTLSVTAHRSSPSLKYLIFNKCARYISDCFVEILYSLRMQSSL